MSKHCQKASEPVVRNSRTRYIALLKQLSSVIQLDMESSEANKYSGVKIQLSDVYGRAWALQNQIRSTAELNMWKNKITYGIHKKRQGALQNQLYDGGDEQVMLKKTDIVIDFNLKHVPQNQISSVIQPDIAGDIVQQAFIVYRSKISSLNIFCSNKILNSLELTNKANHHIEQSCKFDYFQAKDITCRSSQL